MTREVIPAVKAYRPAEREKMKVAGYTTPSRC